MAKTITHIDDDETKPAMFGEMDLLETAKSKTFTEMIFEVLTEKEPSSSEVKLLNLILDLSVDHGPNAPSAAATIESSKSGKTMGESVGAGMAQIGDRHGGAGGPLMELMYSIKKESKNPEEVVKEYLDSDKRIPGLGHRVYKQSLPSEDGKESDPRAQLIFEEMTSLGIGEEYIKIVKDLRDEFFKQTGKSLTVNIDGAIAAVFCGFGLKPELGIAVFIIARAPGLCAHFIATNLKTTSVNS